ncbi:hypothetical protein [Actinophytocola glycyrrhizae]|uniref:HEAT repeat domain-containing protein n=1 Tax=Actinophytocola glycyrrhizae TaxID=2044873 RepID=A0ABV9SHK4_9PSEU
MRDPLAGLADVPWRQFDLADGVAVGVPDRLRMLRSEHLDTRAGALTWLSRVPGSTVGAAVVGFLVALVDDPATPDREALVSLLHDVALGDVSLPLPDDFEPDDAFRTAAKHVDSYVAWLADPLLAAQAAELLAYFPMSQTVVDALLASAAPASANLTLGYVTGYPSIDSHLTAALESTARDVRMTAAVALAFRLGGDLPGPALDLLVDEPPPPAPPGWDRSMRGFVTLALRQVGL